MIDFQDDVTAVELEAPDKVALARAHLEALTGDEQAQLAQQMGVQREENATEDFPAA